MKFTEEKLEKAFTGLFGQDVIAFFEISDSIKLEI